MICKVSHYYLVSTCPYQSFTLLLLLIAKSSFIRNVELIAKISEILIIKTLVSFVKTINMSVLLYATSLRISSKLLEGVRRRLNCKKKL